MKRIIKALFGGLGVSIVLCALFPSIFLKNDAKWTYQSDVGRVDVAFAGEVCDGKINVQGKTLRVDRPQWIHDDKHNQGVVVHFPVSYLRKTYQITLKPWGKTQETSLIMSFRGKDLRIQNQRKPAYVRFENIRLNGKAVAREKTVWHNKPFKYRLEKISDNSNVILSFDVRKPVSASDIRWDMVIGLFVLCSLFVFFSYGAIRGFVCSTIEWIGVMISDVGKFLKFHNWKILISVILTLLANILCIPLWTELDYADFIKTLFSKEAGLSLVYEDKTSGETPFQLQSTPQPLNDPSPFLIPATNPIKQIDLNFRARGKWQKLSLQLKSQRDGKIELRLRGPKIFDDYGCSYYSVLTDWRNLKVNGTVLFDANKTLSLKKCFSKQIPVKENETLHVEAEFRRHHFTTRDFAFLKSGNLWYFITGNLLLFFLLLRLFGAFAKRLGRPRLSDTLLLVTFFCCLFIPMMNLSDGVKSARENRMLAVKPEPREIFKKGFDYGKRYQNYFNDHFWGRLALIKLQDVIRNKLSYVIRVPRAVYFKESGWDFFVPFVSIMDCRPTTLQAIVQNLIQLDLFCRQNNIKLYVFEVPKKESIYKEFLSDKYGFDEKEFVKVSQAQEAIRREVWKHHIPYVYPYEELRDAAQQDLVFFKYAHHWTDWGAFVGYCELMKEVCKDFPDMPVVSLKDYRKSKNYLQRDEYQRNYFSSPRHFAQFFNDETLDITSPRTFYTYYDHKNGDKMSIKVGKFTKDFAYPEGKYKVMLIGTSQNENLLQFLPYSVAQTKYIRLNMSQVKAADQFKILKLYKKDILAFKPDILVLSITTDNLPQLRDLCSTK